MAILLFLMLCAFLPGCLTISYHDRVSGYGSPRNEFSDSAGFVVYRGRIIEHVTVKNRPGTLLQFDGVLKGEGRWFEIHIPNEPGLNFIYTESSKRRESSAQAFLLVEYTSVARGYDDLMSYSPAAETADPAGLIGRKMKVPLSGRDFPVALSKMSLNNVKKFYSSVWRYDLKGNGRATVRYYGDLERKYSVLEIRWHRRSKIMKALYTAGYILPVAGDIVTSPLQLIGAIVYFAMGGAAK